MTSAKTSRLLALAAVVSLAVAACSSSTATTAPTTGPTPTTAPGATDAPTPEPGTLPTPELTSIKIGLSNTEMSEWAPIIAVETGIFEKYGIKAEYSIFEGDAKVIGALQAGQIDVGWNGVSSVIASQLTDAPLVVLGVNAVILTDDIVCQAGIKTAEDAAGKTVAISTFGGTSHGAALLGSQALGLGATGMVFTQVGGQTARIAALVGGSIDCAVVDTNKQAEMLGLGFSIVVELKNANLDWGRAGFDATKEWVAAHPNTALVLAAGALEGQQVIWNDPATVEALHQQVTQSSPEEAKLQVTDFQTVGNRSLMWTDAAFNNPRKILATVNPDIIDVPLDSAFDRSFLQTLVDNGFYDKIGAPHP